MDENETINWFEINNIDIKQISKNYKSVLSEKVPIDSGQKNCLAKNIAEIFNGNEVLLYINEYGIWPSCENIELYCLLDMILYFFMGCVIMNTKNTDEIIFISHDEFINVYTKKDTKIIMNSMKKIMEIFKK